MFSADITTTDPVSDWKYVSEGGATIVFSYIGPSNPAFDGMVLRLRKVPNVPVGVREDSDSDTDEEDDDEEEEDPSISFQRRCMARLVPPVHLPKLRSVLVRMDPVRSISIDQATGTYTQTTHIMPGDFHGPPHIHSNRWLRTLSKAHDAERPANRKKGGGVDVHKQKGVLATDLVGGEGVSVEIKPKWSFLPNTTYLSPTTKPIKSQTCRFCMHSFVRSHSDTSGEAHAHAQGEVAQGYCPLDLFSNDETRIRKALNVLWDAWEESEGKVNNLKIFVEGKMLRAVEKHHLMASSYPEADSPSTPTGSHTDIKELFISSMIPPLMHTEALQTLNRLQRTLDAIDVEGLGRVWTAYHSGRQEEAAMPDLGSDMEEPTLDEWDVFIEDYLAQIQNNNSQFLPGPLPDSDTPQYTEDQLRSYLLAYLLSATFKDCSVIVRIPLLSSSATASSEISSSLDPRNVTIIDLDPKSMTRLRKWEALDAEIVQDYARLTSEGERRVCVDAWGGSA